MSDFLQHFAQEILNSLNSPAPCTRVILPSRRAISTVKRGMAQHLKGPIFLPVFQTMGDFIAELAGLTVADTGTLALSLYSTYTQQIDDPRPLEDYLSWAPTLLNDFNDIDLSLAPVPAIFHYLSKARAIELWNLNRDPLTDFQQQYLHFWDKMPNIYNAFKKHCIENGMTYQGMAARKLAEQDLESVVKKEIVLFAGLNLLSKAEEKIIGHFLSHQKGMVYWQADEYYLQDKTHEAGRFIRTYHEKWKSTGQSVLITGNSLASEAKNILQIGCTGSSGQVQLAADLIQSIPIQEQQNIGLILGDEKLLMPLLGELPKDIEFNITKNLSINQTPYWRWLQQIIKNISSTERQDKHSLSGKIIHQFFLHPITDSVFPWSRKNEWSKHFVQKGKAWWKKSEFVESIANYQLKDEFVETIVSLLFPSGKWEEEFQIILKALEQIGQQLNAQFKDENNFLYLQAMASVAAYRQSGNQIFQSGLAPEMTWFIFQSILEGTAGKVGLSSVGQQESNIQIMGLLESRGIDFDTLIVLGANDGNLPNHAWPHTFIPLDIRREYQLPGKNEREALFAYHFYRLLQKPKQIYLLYSTQTDEFGSGEKSRYLQQLDFEANKKNPNINLTEHIVHRALPEDMHHAAWNIKNNEEIIESLKQFFQKGISPTSLSSLKNCNLQFYFRYLAKVREPEEIEEILQSNTVGSAIHLALENYYEPFVKQLKFDFPDLKLIPVLIKASFAELFGNPELNNGYNHLYYQMAVRLSELRIKNDKNWFAKEPDLIISALEEKLERKLQVGKLQVLLKGTADRIQESNYEIQILDYKSGSVQERDLKLPDEIGFENIPDKALQLLTYSWLAEGMNKEGNSKNIKAGILPLKKSSKDVLWLVSKEPIEVWLQQFEPLVSNFLAQLLEPNYQYQKTENTDTCLYCAYKGVCNR
jgi:ATP-dependent helicase/nuclease subunit B